MKGSVDARSDGILKEDSVYRVDHCIHTYTYVLKKFSGVVAAATITAAVAVLCKLASKKGFSNFLHGDVVIIPTLLRAEPGSSVIAVSILTDVAEWGGVPFP
ncbi:unnamed protein product [Cercopithifilaria johnstoni]|uniref:Uncharacterized protein n=1 Tax=Cercopithifilaria johnstoni TaxID=2874296 RepID=A0A8J2MBI6_9BILA|nr:unnamed protein product [Cercopithifilaria johnstoni]